MGLKALRWRLRKRADGMAFDAVISPNQSEKVSSLARDAHSHFLINVASNVLYTGLTAAAMALYIPFLVRHLGVAAYGIIPLTHMSIMYIATVTDGLNIAVNRYLSIDLYRGDLEAANATFSTATAITLAAIGLLLPLGSVVAWLFPTIFRIPPGLEAQSQILVACMLATFFLSILEANFAVSTFVHHRFDLRNVVRGLTMAVRMGVPAACFMLMPAELWQVGLGFVLGGLLSLIGFGVLWRVLTPQLSFSWTAVDRSRSRELISVSGWALVNRLGMLLFLSTDLVIINWYFGPAMTGQYGVLLLFPELIRQLVEAITSVLNPAIISRYAAKDFKGLELMASRSLKLLGLGLAVPVGLLCGFANPFLKTWLGPQFQHLDWLLVVLVGHLCINMAALPLSLVVTSYNHVRIQGIVTLALSVVNVALALALTPLGLIGVALATAIVMTIRSVIFMAGYCAHLMKLPATTFHRPLLSGLLGTLAVGGSAYMISRTLRPEGWIELGSLAALVTTVYGILAFWLILSRKERSMLLSLMPFGRLMSLRD